MACAELSMEFPIFDLPLANDTTPIGFSKKASVQLLTVEVRFTCYYDPTRTVRPTERIKEVVNLSVVL